VTPPEVGDTPRPFEARWIEVPDYRGLIERLAAMTERSGFPSEIIAAYDALANEAQAILKETEAAS
jgi:hypothetical protein